MTLSTNGIESLGYKKSSNGDGVLLNFQCCYIYTTDNIKLRESDQVFEYKCQEVTVFIGADVLSVYYKAMGFNMFIGPGGAHEDDLKPYKGKVVVLIKPARPFSKKLYNYYSQENYGVVMLYDAFESYKSEYTGLVTKSVNKTLFDFKVNFYSENNRNIALEFRTIDFFGVDSSGIIYMSSKIVFEIKCSSSSIFEHDNLGRFFFKHTPNDFSADFISIYSQVASEMEPFKEYLLTYASMESYVSESFTRLRKKINAASVKLDDWSYYEIATQDSLSLQQKFFFVSKYLWNNHTNELCIIFKKFSDIRNDLAHRGAPRRGESIDCHGLKNFYFNILSFRII